MSEQPTTCTECGRSKYILIGDMIKCPACGHVHKQLSADDHLKKAIETTEKHIETVKLQISTLYSDLKDSEKKLKAMHTRLKRTKTGRRNIR